MQYALQLDIFWAAAFIDLISSNFMSRITLLQNLCHKMLEKLRIVDLTQKRQ